MTKHKQIAQLHIRLQGFAQPDTQSQLEGSLEPGKYIVKEYQPNHPNADTDYALLLAPALGAGDTWICTCWKDQHYARIVESTSAPIERLLFDSDPLAIPEEALVNLLSQFE